MFYVFAEFSFLLLFVFYLFPIAMRQKNPINKIYGSLIFKYVEPFKSNRWQNTGEFTNKSLRLMYTA